MTTTYPGITPITQQSFANGATSPRTDAIQQQANMNQKQALINQAGQGRGNRRRKYRGGANSSNQVTVPQFQMQYTPTGGPGTNPNDQVASGSKTGMQSNANSVYDNQAAKMGGRRRYRKGGNPNWSWGCYSGGKSKRRASRKTRKHRKKTRRHYSH
jgi:hypothetical protein